MKIDFRKDSFKFWLYLRGFFQFHLDVPNLELWLGNKLKESDKRKIRLGFAFIGFYLLTQLIQTFFKIWFYADM